MPSLRPHATLVLVVLTFAAAGATAQPATMLEVIESDEPRASLDLGERLVLALGRPWADVAAGLVAPDSGSVEGGAGRLVWTVPDYAVDAFQAEVRAGIVAGAVLDFSDEGPDFFDYAGRLHQQHGGPGRDGFYDADALDLPFDLAVRPDDRRLDFRAVAGRTVPADTPLPIQFRAAPSEPDADPAPPPRDTSRVYDVADELPEIVGGLGALMNRVVYPADALAEGVGGTVVVRFVINTDGAASEVAAVRSPDERLSQAAIAAVRQTRFWPGHTDGLPVRMWFAVPVRFAASAGDGGPR